MSTGIFRRPIRRLSSVETLGTMRAVAKSFGERLREAREARGLGVNELNRKLGLTDGYVSRMEHGGRANPSLEILVGLARHLDVSLDWLVLAKGAGPNEVETDAAVDRHDLGPLRERPEWAAVRVAAQRRRRRIPGTFFERVGDWAAPGQPLTVGLLLSIVDALYLTDGQDEAEPERIHLEAEAPASKVAEIADGPPTMVTTGATQKIKR